MIKIFSANDFDESINEKMSYIFVEGFYQWLKFFSIDKDRLFRAFRHMFNRDVFYVAKIDGQIAGIAALNSNITKTVQLNQKEFYKHLGALKGFFAYKILKHEFEDKRYPFTIKPGMACVEFIATSLDFRNKGVASALITHFFSLPQYSEYVLEVADTNVTAIKLYKKLGFREFKRVEMKNRKQSGVNFLLYMNYEKK